ncbi:phage antirepressor KilAC domain-containing protein [Xanthobacter sp. V3C-3]|uniref:phage antirepressor KilAC domain-containing protein n=1 Tax=Xanthobacter lutulentifluminis TaxID=3119935 RepID=UPI00372C4D38
MSNDVLTFGAGRRPGEPLTMSSHEIARILKSRHDTVKLSIERLAKRCVFELPPSTEVKNHLGQTVEIYHLDKRSSLIVVAQLSPEFTAQVVDRWQQLEAEVAAGRPVLPDFTDPVMAARAWADEVEAKTIARQRAAALEAKVKEQSVKVAALDRIATANGSTCISTSAKTLQMKPSELFTYMRNHGWIFRRGGNGRYVAHQPRINAGYLEHKVEVIPGKDGDEHTFEQVRVTPRGLTVLARLLGKPTQGSLL